MTASLPIMTPEHLQLLEQHPQMRKTIIDALTWLDEREASWNLEQRIDRSTFAQNLLDQLCVEQRS